MKPKYEWLRVRNVWHDDFIYEDNGKHMSWTESIPEGWYAAFGEQLIDELNEILVKHDIAHLYRIIQIKEKFGKLCWYDNGVPEKAWEEYNEWLEKYEIMSEKFCIYCGKPSTHKTKGWVEYVCEEHYQE